MSRARQRRRARAWVAYQRRNDALVAHQGRTRSLRHPMQISPGFWRHFWGYSRYFVHQMRKAQGGSF